MKKRICVFGASYTKLDKQLIDAGAQLGRLIARSGDALVFGGGEAGMMGAVASGVSEVEGGEIIGIVPHEFNTPQILYSGCTKVIVTDGISERKDRLIKESDAFIAMPGGLGTIDEIIDVFVRRQLGMLGNKPVCIVNLSHTFDSFLNMLSEYAKNPMFPSDIEEYFAVVYSVEDAMKHINQFLWEVK